MHLCMSLSANVWDNIGKLVSCRFSPTCQHRRWAFPATHLEPDGILSLTLKWPEALQRGSEPKEIYGEEAKIYLEGSFVKALHLTHFFLQANNHSYKSEQGTFWNRSSFSASEMVRDGETRYFWQPVKTARCMHK